MDTLLLIISGSAVLFMVVGLGLFYAGQTNERSVTHTLLMSLGAFATVLPGWVLIGHWIGFGTWNDAHETVLFQGAFAVLATALISGALVSRIKFAGWLIFSALWSLLVYAVLVNWTWNTEGWLYKLGAIDLAGGGPIHIASGTAGLVVAYIIGKRLTDKVHHNVPTVVLGFGVLLFGWFFFNGGSVFAVNETTSLVVLNTGLAAAVGALTWMVIDLARHKTVTALSAAMGGVAALVGITPSAAVVNELGATIIAILSASTVWYVLSKRAGKIDDALDVAGVHLVAGVVGSLSIGLVATETGLFYGGGIQQLGYQTIAVTSTIGYTAIVTLVLALLLQRTIGLRVRPDQETIGVDAEHPISI